MLPGLDILSSRWSQDKVYSFIFWWKLSFEVTSNRVRVCVAHRRLFFESEKVDMLGDRQRHHALCHEDIWLRVTQPDFDTLDIKKTRVRWLHWGSLATFPLSIWFPFPCPWGPGQFPSTLICLLSVASSCGYAWSSDYTCMNLALCCKSQSNLWTPRLNQLLFPSIISVASCSSSSSIWRSLESPPH